MAAGNQTMPGDHGLIVPGSIEDRAIGALVGLAAGDALGSSVKSMNRGDFPPVTGMQGGGPLQLNPGEWTGDTSMALALGDALLHDTALQDPSQAMNRWLHWHRHGSFSHNGTCFDTGTQTAAALAKWESSRTLPLNDPDAAGNGCIGRLAPVVLANLKNPAQMRRVASRQCNLTHNNAECRDTSEKLSLLIAACIDADAAAIAEQIPDEIAGRHQDGVKSTGYVVDTFDAAVWAFAPQDGFENILLRAVNLGGDADTVGAVAGQIAGARYGLSQIPISWLTVLAWRDDIIELARNLYQLATEPAAKRPLPPSRPLRPRR
jgi:ADP-ribosyl-[dinitrogen reductase] hydrolase